MIFYPVGPGDLQSANLLIRVRNGDVDGFAPRVREITAALDPELRLESLGNLATMGNARLFATMVSVLILVLASVLLLSAAGIHALISLAVTRRRREIAIRRALGGHARLASWRPTFRAPPGNSGSGESSARWPVVRSWAVDGRGRTRRSCWVESSC